MAKIFTLVKHPSVSVCLRLYYILDEIFNDPEVVEALKNAQKKAAKKAKVEHSGFTAEQEKCIKKWIQEVVEAGPKKSRNPANKKVDEKLDEITALLNTIIDSQNQNQGKINSKLDAMNTQNVNAQRKIYRAIQDNDQKEKPGTPGYEQSSSRSPPSESPSH